LATVVGKRAKELEKTIPDVIDNSQDKAISLAAKELDQDKIITVNPDKE
jgi:DNA-directed RNA polymerase subunit K/omega